MPGPAIPLISQTRNLINLGLGIVKFAEKAKESNQLSEIAKGAYVGLHKEQEPPIGNQLISWIKKSFYKKMQKDQNVKIAMQNIDWERFKGKKFTSQEIDERIKRAEKSDREFTWWGAEKNTWAEFNKQDMEKTISKIKNKK